MEAKYRITELIKKHKPVKDVFVVCYGTSLTYFKWELLQKKFTIGVNNAVYKVPNLNIHLFSDKKLWKEKRSYYKIDYGDTALVVQRGKLEEVHKMRPDIEAYGFLRTNTSRIDTVKFDDHKLYMSRTVACPAIQLAWKLGADNIYVMGFDGYDLKKQTYCDGVLQLHSPKKEVKKEENRIILTKHQIWDRQVKRMLKCMRDVQPDFHIFNLSSYSTISSIPKPSKNELTERRMYEFTRTIQ